MDNTKKKPWEEQADRLANTAAKYSIAATQAHHFFQICERAANIVGQHNVEIDSDIWTIDNPFFVSVTIAADPKHLPELRKAFGRSKVTYKEVTDAGESIRLYKVFDSHPQVTLRVKVPYKENPNGKCKVVMEVRSYNNYSLVCS